MAISQTSTAVAANATGIAVNANATVTVGSQRTATAVANFKAVRVHDITAAKVFATTAAADTRVAATVAAGSPTPIARLHATQTAVAGLPTPASVAVPPVAAYTYSGCSVSLTTAANGTPLPAADWQVNAGDGSGWSDVTATPSFGTTYSVGTDADNTLTIATSDGMNGYKYRAVFDNDGGGGVTGVVALRFVPTIASVYPTHGSAAGTTLATQVITGTALTDSTGTKPTVKFGNLVVDPSNIITNVGDTGHITVTGIPASPTGGLVDVTATTIGGTSPISTTNDGYTYGPRVTGVSPIGGPDDDKTTTVITITGSGFDANDTVLVGGVMSSNTGFVSSTDITATAPLTSTASTVEVVISSTNGDESPSTTLDRYSYLGAPTVTGVSPVGQAVGAKITQQVVITGTNFVPGGTTVKFGTRPATNVVVGGTTTITATSPAVSSSSSSTVGVLATTLGGTSAISTTDSYIYAMAPAVSDVAVISGTSNITITGTDYYAGATVKCGANGATSPVVVSVTEITATCPYTPTAMLDIFVLSLGGKSSASSGDKY